jgi:putative nucleotidyltransferase with HDIG domain
MADPDVEDPQPKRTRRIPALVARFALSERWTERVAQTVLLAVVSLAAAFVISPSLYSPQIPDLGPEDLGKPFRSNSPAGFKANRDYEIVHQGMTEQRRQEARAAVRPVYDYSPAVLGELKQSVRDAFVAMREVVSRFQESTAEKAASPRAQEEPEGVVARKGKKREPLPPMNQEVLSKQLWAERRYFDQKLFPVEEEEFEALVAAGFSRDAELATISLIERAYPSPVATSRDELSQAGSQGIAVRTLPGMNEHLTSAAPPVINDLREAKAELERFASIPGSYLPEAPTALRRAVLRLAKRQIRPNLTINIAETEARRIRAADAVKEALIQIKKGQKVIGDGELINDTHLILLKTMRAQTEHADPFGVRVGSAGLVALLIAAGYAFHRAAFKRFRPTRKDAVLLGSLLVAMLLVIRLLVAAADALHDKYGRIPAEALYFAIPVAAGAALVRFVLTQEMALFFAIVLAALSGVMLGNSLPFGVYALIGSLVAADRIARAKDRMGIFRAGLMVGAVNVLTVLLFSLAEGKGLSADALITGTFSFVGNSLALPAMVMAITPLIEIAFGYASDIKLLELANLNHPALKELIVQAPGTYHHSIILGSLVEAAAEAIGANPLLARSCAYYHDIGKGRNPLYFGENQRGENRHDTLAPAMSAVIIKRHVTEGMEMARQYKLPKAVADAIPQHHGTRLVGYFYHKALKEQEGKESPQPIDEGVYRYPGPKPQFREAALVMIADAVEAASRTMPEPAGAKLQALVQKLISSIFSEGQLDECDLTLRDLNLIAQSFLRTLEGIYHSRRTYPPGATGAGRLGTLPPVEGLRPVSAAAGGKPEMKVGRQG